MRKVAIIGATLLLCLVFYQSYNRNEGPAVQTGTAGEVGIRAGNLAPDFSLMNMEGESVTLSQFRGKVVMLNFWATWCPPCRMEIPSMERLHNRLKGQDFVILAVNVEREGKAAVAAFNQELPHSFPVLLDDSKQVQGRYKVRSYPETFIIDKDGVIVEKVLGARRWDDTGYLKLFSSLMGR